MKLCSILQEARDGRDPSCCLDSRSSDVVLELKPPSLADDDDAIRLLSSHDAAIRLRQQGDRRPRSTAWRRPRAPRAEQPPPVLGWLKPRVRLAPWGASALATERTAMMPSVTNTDGCLLRVGSSLCPHFAEASRESPPTRTITRVSYAT